ncbi:hypothetical protein SAMN05216555_102122 [Arthrobacter cupressi]|uniref:Uncharacterized protein n=1 Tax=Arthrobacter cupressi TaxID=1045773 RepID=A0A1G8K3N9_9MICC|nr:hypothetical protein [Arthrobacter cupressi]SDI38023.1 hypothetical protein SAMN05216555_102122 [Arthrobacter cupressi]
MTAPRFPQPDHRSIRGLLQTEQAVPAQAGTDHLRHIAQGQASVEREAMRDHIDVHDRSHRLNAFIGNWPDPMRKGAR